MKKTAMLLILLLIPQLASAQISIDIQASRTSGVAPLSVFFDATGTTGLYDTEFFADDWEGSNAAYMDATFAWDFDTDNNDPDGKYEKGSGFVAAHVFEDPGTYRVHLDVYDAAGNTASEDLTITVTEFSGTTYYVASDGDDSNLGTIDEPFLTVSKGLSMLAPNVKVLFRNGDTFDVSNELTVSGKTGPAIVSNYNDPDDPSEDKPIIHATFSNGGYHTVMFTNSNDIRIIDMQAMTNGHTYNGEIRYPAGIEWGYGCVHMLKLRTEEYETGQVSMSPKGQYTAIQDCVFHDTAFSGYTSNVGGATNDGNAIIGNWVYNKSTDGNTIEHVFRVQGGSRYYIAHNTFDPVIYVNFDSLTIRGESEKIVIYNNKITGWVQKVGPKNPESEEYQHHVIWDSNLIMGQGLYTNDRHTGIALCATDIVVRNNVIYDYLTGTSMVDHPLTGFAHRIKIYNNDFINPTSDSPFTGARVKEGCTDIFIKNNLMLDVEGSSPTSTRFIYIEGGSVLSGISDYNMMYATAGDWARISTSPWDLSLSEWQSATDNDDHSFIEDPDLASTDPENENFAKPQSGSPAINAAEVLPYNALDFYGNLRDSQHDIGAVEYMGAYTCSNGIQDGDETGVDCGGSCPACVTSITQHGITWTFDKGYRTGQFANGDWWVLGPVTIIDIDPASVEADGRFMHGSMINPSANIGQGFDSGSSYFDYDHSLNVAYGVTSSNPLTVPIGSSLISTISLSTPAYNTNLKSAEILTVLDEVPADGSFRPPYTGTDKTINYNKDQLNYDLLLSLSPVSDTPSLSSMISSVQRPWIDFETRWYGEFIHPTDNMPAYGREIAQTISSASLMLHLNFNEPEKKALLIPFVQMGIDFYAIMQDSQIHTLYGWLGEGGFGAGRKWSIIFAGLMLDDDGMKSIGQKSGDYAYLGDPGTTDLKNPLPADYIHFGEDDQTFYVTSFDVEKTHSEDWNPSTNNNNNPVHPYETEDTGMPEWGIRHSWLPYQDNKDWLADYRSATAIAWQGFVLSVIMMNAKTLWNHDVLFDYQDRYMAITNGDADPFGYTVQDEETGWRAWSAFAANMWDEYRDDFGCMPVSGSWDCVGETVNCDSVMSCSEYPNNRALNYDPCGLGCGSVPTCQNQGYLCCDSCSSGPHTEYDSDCSGQVCCEECAQPCLTSSGTWSNTPFAAQTGTFTLEFDATPDSTNMDAITALSAAPGTDFDYYGVLVRFINYTVDGPGYIDARNGDSYSSDISFQYSPGTQYHFRLEVNVPSHTYSVYVTPEGQAEQTLAEDYAFRTEQATVTQLGYMGIWSNTDYGSDTHQVCNYGIVSYHRADTTEDGCVDLDEMLAFMNRWKVSVADVPMPELMEAIGLWKAGTGCIS